MHLDAGVLELRTQDPVAERHDREADATANEAEQELLQVELASPESEVMRDRRTFKDPSARLVSPLALPAIAAVRWCSTSMRAASWSRTSASTSRTGSGPISKLTPSHPVTVASITRADEGSDPPSSTTSKVPAPSSGAVGSPKLPGNITRARPAEIPPMRTSTRATPPGAVATP